MGEEEPAAVMGSCGRKCSVWLMVAALLLKATGNYAEMLEHQSTRKLLSSKE